MNCACGTEISETAAAECSRLDIPARCSFHLCEYFRRQRFIRLLPMPERKRERYKALRESGRCVSCRKPSGEYAKCRDCRRGVEPEGLKLVADLTPRQLELFDRWQRSCEAVGFIATVAERDAILREIRRAA